jgi:hypothetical protein
MTSLANGLWFRSLGVVRPPTDTLHPSTLAARPKRVFPYAKLVHVGKPIQTTTIRTEGLSGLHTERLEYTRPLDGSYGRPYMGHIIACVPAAMRAEAHTGKSPHVYFCFELLSTSEYPNP